MKKLNVFFSVILFCMMFLTSSTIIATNQDVATQSISKETSIVEVDALRCSVYDSGGDLIGRCYMCDCGKFGAIICGCAVM